MKKHLKTLCKVAICIALGLIVYSFLYQNLVDYDYTNVKAANYYDAVDKLGIKAMISIPVSGVILVIIKMTEE